MEYAAIADETKTMTLTQVSRACLKSRHESHLRHANKVMLHARCQSPHAMKPIFARNLGKDGNKQQRVQGCEEGQMQCVMSNMGPSR